MLSSGTALAADTFKKLSWAVVPVLMLVAWPARGAEVTRVVSAMDCKGLMQVHPDVEIMLDAAAAAGLTAS